MKGYKNKEELKDKYSELQSMSKVAEYYGVSKKLILNYMKRFEIERKPVKIEIDMNKAVNMFYDGVKLKGISESLNVSVGTLRQRFNEIGIDTDTYHKKYIQKDSGYILVLCPEHPKADKRGYVPEHTLMMEYNISRYLHDDEVVHHINGIKNDNRIDNLKLMTAYEHKSFHSGHERKIIDINHISEMLSNGYTLSEVSQIYSISQTTIRKKLKRYGLYKPLPKGTPSHSNNRIKTL